MRETDFNVAERNLLLFEATIADGGHSSVAALARRTGIPVASAHRHIAALVRAGFLVPAGYGRHLPGPKLRSLAVMASDKQILINAAKPILGRLSARIRCVVQLGIYENEMVTYLVKAGQSAGDLFTKVGMQLEAYCSGIGKVLLAHLPTQVRTEYLAGGPFIALTAHTITDPGRLEVELDRVATQQFAIDDEEIVTGLQCVAVPVRNSQGAVIAAISSSRKKRLDDQRWQDRLLPLLQMAARETGMRAG